MQWFVYIGVIVLIGALLYLLLKTVPALLAMSASDMPDVPMLDSIKLQEVLLQPGCLQENTGTLVVLDSFDVFSTGIYLYKGLYLAAGLYSILQWQVGYIRWKRNMSNSQPFAEMKNSHYRT